MKEYFKWANFKKDLIWLCILMLISPAYFIRGRMEGIYIYSLNTLIRDELIVFLGFFAMEIVRALILDYRKKKEKQ